MPAQPSGKCVLSFGECTATLGTASQHKIRWKRGFGGLAVISVANGGILVADTPPGILWLSTSLAARAYFSHTSCLRRCAIAKCRAKQAEIGNNSSILDWPRVCGILLQLVQPGNGARFASSGSPCALHTKDRAKKYRRCVMCSGFPSNLVPTGKDRLVTPKEVLALCREKDVKAVDLRFMDFPGMWQHFTIPVDKLDEDVFEDGLGFDGSSIRGWQAINESDMLVVPQPETAFHRSRSARSPRCR